MGVSTQVTDIIVPEILTESVAAAFEKVNLLYGTGAVVMNSTFKGGQTDVGNTVKIPYFGNIGEFDDVAAGSALQPSKITQTSEEATVQHSGKLVSINNLVKTAGVDDIYAEATRQIMTALTRKIDSKLIAAAIASLPAMTYDAYTSGSLMSYDVAADTMQKFGDEADAGDYALWGMHSKVRNDLLKAKDGDGKPLLTLNGVQGGMSMFYGVASMVSDKLTPTTDSPPKYTSMLAQRGALACWINPGVVIEVDKDIAADDWIMAVHVYYVVHRYSRMPGKTKPGIALAQHR